MRRSLFLVCMEEDGSRFTVVDCSSAKPRSFVSKQQLQASNGAMSFDRRRQVFYSIGSISNMSDRCIVRVLEWKFKC